MSEGNSGIFFFPVLAALVGMAVGFVSIWSQIRGQNRQAKLEAEAARIDLEKRMRDYLNLKLDNIDMKIEHLKENMIRLERKINSNSNNRNKQQNREES